MKQLRRILALMVCAAMLLSLCACKQDPVGTSEPTTAPTTPPAPTEPTTEPTISHEEAAALYQAALEAVNASETLSLRITQTWQTNVAGEIFENSTEQTVTYTGIGTDTFLASVAEEAVYGDYDVDISEVYSAGVVYATVNDFDYSVELTQEEYVSRFVPAAMLEPSIYTAIEVTETDGGQTLTFTLPSALESWLGEEDAKLVSASGTAQLDASGALTETFYSAVYAYGGTEISTEVTVTILTEVSEPQVPADTAGYVLFESVDAPLVMEMTYGYLQQGNRISVDSLESMVTQAGGFMLNSQMNIDTYGNAEDQMIQIEQSFHQADSTGAIYESDFTETYRDGKYTSVTDDERPVENSSVDLPSMRNYYQGILTEDLPELYEIATANATDLGSVYLFEYTLTEEAAVSIGQAFAKMLWGSASFLDNLASKYETNIKDFYLSVDRYTGLPVAMGINYEGCHTIEGYDYLLMHQIDYSFDLASLDSYEAITEEPYPDTEPEEKPTPLFYHVTGSDGQEMWLFGTIHVGDSRTAYLPQEIYDAFAASDALAVECDTDAFEEQVEDDEELQEQVSDAYYYSDGTTTKDHVEDEELYEYTLQLLKATGNFNMNSLYMKPYLWSNMIENFFMRQGRAITSDKGVESRLMQMAEEQNKPVREVESSLFQIQMITGYSDELQEEMLSGSASGTAQEYWEGLTELYGLWCAGNEAELIEYLKDDTSEMTEEELELYNEYNKAMSTDRNAGMLEVAKEYLESGDVVFYAVGLAHLLAEDGLVNTLREAGYTVELVAYSGN